MKISFDILCASLALDRGCDELLVCDATAYDGGYKTIQAFQRVSLDVAIVQPPSEFVHVPLDVLLRSMVIDAVESAFHNSPNGFDTV